jgi:hypothetical protein
MKDTGGSAFPLHSEVRPSLDTDWCGMTLRDYFAAKAMQSLMHTQYVDMTYEGEPAAMAFEAYALADAMLAERSKP